VLVFSEMPTYLNTVTKREPYQDFDNEEYLDTLVDVYNREDPWTLEDHEFEWLTNIHADRIFLHWGYWAGYNPEDETMTHSNFEKRTGDLPGDLVHIQAYTDPLMRILAKLFGRGYIDYGRKVDRFEVVNLMSRQDNYALEPLKKQNEISEMLMEFLQDATARRAIRQLAFDRVSSESEKLSSMALLSLIVSARIFLLMAERYYETAYETSQKFLAFEKRFDDLWTPKELSFEDTPSSEQEESTSGVQDISTCCLRCHNIAAVFCGHCKKGDYCSLDCQKADWPNHSRVCDN
jgi:hypothetical protein